MYVQEEDVKLQSLTAENFDNVPNTEEEVIQCEAQLENNEDSRLYTQDVSVENHAQLVENDDNVQNTRGEDVERQTPDNVADLFLMENHDSHLNSQSLKSQNVPYDHMRINNLINLNAAKKKTQSEALTTNASLRLLEFLSTSALPINQNSSSRSMASSCFAPDNFPSTTAIPVNQNSSLRSMTASRSLHVKSSSTAPRLPKPQVGFQIFLAAETLKLHQKGRVASNYKNKTQTGHKVPKWDNFALKKKKKSMTKLAKQLLFSKCVSIK